MQIEGVAFCVVAVNVGQQRTDGDEISLACALTMSAIAYNVALSKLIGQ